MNATGRVRALRRCVLSAQGLSVLALAGCGSGDAEPAPLTSTLQPRPEEQSATQPFETEVFARLRRVDPQARGTEHGALYDAHAQAKLGNDRVRMDIYPSRIPPLGRLLRVERFSHIRTSVRSGNGGRVYRFRCDIEGFGRKAVVLSSVATPAKTIPAAHRALGCSTVRR
jgi:hypothetical protein